MEYKRNRLYWNGCGLMLHELCHLIHQLILPDGLENSQIKSAYECAMRSGIYEEVLRLVNIINEESAMDQRFD